MKPIGTATVVVAWIAFIACLAMPAHSAAGDSELGWQTGLGAIKSMLYLPDKLLTKDALFFLRYSFSGLGNIVMMLLPVALYLNFRKGYGLLAFFFFAETCVAASYFYEFKKSFHAGYYAWVVSFILATIGVGMLAISAKKAQNKPMQDAKIIG